VLERVAELERQLRDLRRQLAMEAPADELPGPSFDVLAARAGADEVALLLEQVEVVVRAAWLTRLPETPPWVLGLLDVHGDQVPVLDLATRIRSSGTARPGAGAEDGRHGSMSRAVPVPDRAGAPAARRQPGVDDLIVICGEAGQRVGLVVQEVHGSARLDRSRVQRPSSQVAHARFVLGVARVDDRTSLLLGVARLLEGAGLELPEPGEPEPEGPR
jgi:chemotaxis signal transduction protein